MKHFPNFFFLTHEEHLLFLCFDCSVDSFGFLDFFPLFPPSIVVVDFIGTMKPN